MHGKVTDVGGTALPPPFTRISSAVTGGYIRKMCWVLEYMGCLEEGPEGGWRRTSGGRPLGRSGVKV